MDAMRGGFADDIHRSMSVFRTRAIGCRLIMHDESQVIVLQVENEDIIYVVLNRAVGKK